MTQLSITAFLAFLSAFNVDPATIKAVQAILNASQATTTLQIATTTSTTVILTPTQNKDTAPTFGAIITTNQPTQQTQMPEDKSAITVSVEPQYLDARTKEAWFALTIRVLDSNGKTLPAQLVTVTSDDGKAAQINVNNRREDPKDWMGSWAYYPASIGDHILTFTSGNLTKQITINVQ